MDDTVRLLNATMALLVAGTLSWRHIYYLHAHGFDGRLRDLTAVMLFGWIAVVSIAAYLTDHPTIQFAAKLNNVELTAAFVGAYLVALWTPWRWRLPRNDDPREGS